ncbi:TetR/AcrR family transcriptional regulator [Chitinimonas sp. BJB300]|uniref:TetR/AcrR family transcriptional regulator n=1 Tax=Chitinimonas sp. BJB300 TaxID=1559339 RepID=UPI000C10D7E8|nr:TetR/AcrR family transcriptional regulator [Chitinimonas sp. BJB300]PHV12358.1 TetR family transcriptional regulator [Chitinimonas sp. BJB300]TSJ91068.1 TetR/AcrR family transcriptional regulator [Chitinimonas sp. BJB300]
MTDKPQEWGSISCLAKQTMTICNMQNKNILPLTTNLPEGRVLDMDTRQALLDNAAELIRTRGYTGFSYADLAERVGIRKPSIHHHFPAKEDLGVALLDQYIVQFEQLLEDISRHEKYPSDQLRAFANLYRSSLEQGWGCVCGMLAADVDVVSPEIAVGVRRFMSMNQHWLTQVLEAGQQQKTVSDAIDSAAQAGMLLAVCQGALLVARAMRSVDGFDQAVNAVLKSFDQTN